MWAADMPMEILGLEIEREHVREQRVECSADVAAGGVAKIGRGGKGRLVAFFDGRILVHGEVSLAANAGTTCLSSSGVLGLFFLRRRNCGKRTRNSGRPREKRAGPWPCDGVRACSFDESIQGEKRSRARLRAGLALARDRSISNPMVSASG